MKNESKLTWKDVVKEALSEIGTSGHLDDIYSKIKGHPKTETNPTWRDTVRRTLQQYSIFYQEEKGSGIWYLREEKPLEEFDPKKNPNPAHEDVQGMLLELGRIYGYETSVAINDARKKFMNIPIEEVATIKEFQRDVFHPKVAEIVSHIDVLWFGGDTDMCLCLSLLLKLSIRPMLQKDWGEASRPSQVRPKDKTFYNLPIDKMSKFDKEIGRSLFRDIKGICRARTYEPLINLYSLAKEHNLQRTEFFGE